MATVPASEASDRFAELFDRAVRGKERVVLRERGVDLAAVVPIEDLNRLQAMEDRIDIQTAHASLAEEGSISSEELKAEFGL